VILRNRSTKSRAVTVKAAVRDTTDRNRARTRTRTDTMTLRKGEVSNGCASYLNLTSSKRGTASSSVTVTVKGYGKLTLTGYKATHYALTP
jgi:hypothetical protein